MKHSLIIKKALFKSGFFSICRTLFREGSAAILRYHSIVNNEDNYYASPSICITPEQFEKQISYLSSHYNIVSLNTLAECVDRKTPFPMNAVVITFDDGYRDNYQAYQILKKYGVTGTFYITAGCVGDGEILWLFEIKYLISSTRISVLRLYERGKENIFPLSSKDNRDIAVRKINEIIKSNNITSREDIRRQIREQTTDVLDLKEKFSKVMLTWEQIKEMSENGMTIGGHTMTHLNLPSAGKEDAFREISECKRLLEEKTGKKVLHFSYPNGGAAEYYNQYIKQVVKESGYITATTSRNGLVDFGSDLFELNRIRISNDLAEIIFQIDCERLIKWS